MFSVMTRSQMQTSFSERHNLTYFLLTMLSCHNMKDRTHYYSSLGGVMILLTSDEHTCVCVQTKGFSPVCCLVNVR